MADSGVPYLADMQRSRGRWRAAFTGLALLSIASVIALIFVAANLSHVLDRRAATVLYIEQLSRQQTCIDEIESNWEEVLSDVVLTGFVRNDPARRQPTLADLRKLEARMRDALNRLDNSLELCPLPPLPRIAQR